MMKLFLVFFIVVSSPQNLQLFLPIGVKNRANPENIKLTDIGQFGLQRKARPTVAAHYHTGIDLKRPSHNYTNEPVYAAGKGKVISMRNDGPFSQIIIEHLMRPGDTVWTVYEHVLGIVCHAGDAVTENTVIARFFNKPELDKYGWQFDHLHFEMLRIRPVRVRRNPRFPEYFYKTYAITCYTLSDLHKRMIDPMTYFSSR